MISFPLFYLAFPFALLYGAWGIFSLFSLYHVARFGYINKITYFATVFFLGASIIVAFLVYDTLKDIDWNYLITIQYS